MCCVHVLADAGYDDAEAQEHASQGDAEFYFGPSNHDGGETYGCNEHPAGSEIPRWAANREIQPGDDLVNNLDNEFDVHVQTRVEQEKIQQEQARKARADADGSHCGPDIGNPDGAGARRLLHDR